MGQDSRKFLLPSFEFGSEKTFSSKVKTMHYFKPDLMVPTVWIYHERILFKDEIGQQNTIQTYVNFVVDFERNS
jgi:hypothetical protein